MENLILSILAIYSICWVISENLNQVPFTEIAFAKGKYYYCPTDETIVYCHRVENGYLILNGHCDFLDDSFTSITRQKILPSEFIKHSPIEIDYSNPGKHPFLSKDNLAKAWSVIDRNKPYKNKFDNAIDYPWVESKNWAAVNYLQSLNP